MPARLGIITLSGVGLLVLASTSGAEDAQAPPEVPNVSLDRLFQLPKDTGVAPRQERRVAGATHGEWVDRFTRAYLDLAEAQASLRGAQDELEDMAAKSDSWQITAPGAQSTPENSPVSFKLRQDIRRYREDIERYEGALTELRIEANLAGVPRSWQTPEVQSDDAQDRVLGRNASPGSANKAVSAK